MGRKGDIEFVYIVSKAVSEDVFEKMRSGYDKAADKFLVNSRKDTVTKEEDMVGEFNRQFLRMSGYSDAEIDKMNPKAIGTEEMQDLIGKKAMSMLGLGTSSQKIVPLFQLRDFIVQGWEFVRDLPNNEAIVRYPN